MICNTIGLTADSYQSMYVHGGDEVAEVYGGLNYADPIFYKSQTMTGSAPLAFDSYPGGITDYTILGNSYQDGIPDPDNPVEIMSVGDKTENLFTPVVNNKYIDPGDGTLKNGNGYKTSDYIPIESNNYYCSAVVTSTKYFQCCYALYDSEKNYIRGASAFRFYDEIGIIQKAAINTMGAAFIRISYNGVLGNEMLNIGSEYVPYEPYGMFKIPITCGGETHNIYLDEPLRKIGNYADEIDFKTGTVVRWVGIRKLVEGSYRIAQIFDDRFTITQSNLYGPIISNYDSNTDYSIYMYPQSSEVAEKFVFGRKYLNLAGVVSGDSDTVKLNKIMAYFKSLEDSGIPFTIYFRYYTPTTESITLPTLNPTPGNNTLSIGTTLQPSAVSITGHIKPSSIYGNLTDVNGVYIHDKDGVQIKVTG